MELGQKGKGLTFKLHHDVPKRYKATAADTARFEKFLKIMIKKTTKVIKGMGQCFSLNEKQLCTKDLIIHDPKSNVIAVTKRKDFGGKNE